MRALFALTVALLLGVAGPSCTPGPVTPAHDVAPVQPVSAPVRATPAPRVRATPVPWVRATPAPTVAPLGGEWRAGPRVPNPRPIVVPQAPIVAPGPALDGLADDILPDPNTAYGLVLEDLTGGARVAVNEQLVFPSASLYKLAVAWVVFRRVDAGVLSLDDALAIEAEDTVEPEPDGGVAEGDAPTVREALAAMLSVSSNAAAHAFLRTIGRPAFNAEMDRLGLAQTRVPENPSSQAAEDGSVAVTSAGDIARLLRLVATSQQLSSGGRAELEHSLARIAPPDALRDTLPTGVDIYDKTGNLDDASNVGALLRSARDTVILVVVDHGVDPGDARGVIARLGQAAYEALLRPPA